jgi:methylamine dehydrogenase accessory protein MauD
MGAALLACRLVLATVFLVAGLAKLADREGSRAAMRGFGLPNALARPFGTLLPFLEIAAGGLLVPEVTARWGALAALVLLAGFVVAIAAALARGVEPDCHCFGQLHSKPAGWGTLLRNIGLGGIAGFVLVGGWNDAGTSATGWIADLSTDAGIALAAGAGLAVALCFQSWFSLQLLRQNGRLLSRMESMEAMIGSRYPAADGGSMLDWGTGLPIGDPAPGFELPGLHGERLTLQSLLARGRTTLLVFSDPKCGPCTALLPDLGRWQAEEDLTVVLISRGDAEDNLAKAREHGVNNVLLQNDTEVSDAYQAHGTPAAVLIAPDGRIASPVGAGAERIRALVDQESADRLELVRRSAANGQQQQQQPQAPPPPQGEERIGQEAPAIELPDLEGNTVRLADFKGRDTLVLFWNPGCGFCQRMLPDLKDWEASKPAGAPEVLVVTTGELEANKEMGLASPTVLDEGFSTGQAFGAGGTPMGVMIDAEGKIASGVAAGADAVFELVAARTGG